MVFEEDLIWKSENISLFFARNENKTQENLGQKTQQTGSIVQVAQKFNKPVLFLKHLKPNMYLPLEQTQNCKIARSARTFFVFFGFYLIFLYVLL